MKACPFCGGFNVVVAKSQNPHASHLRFVRCNHCGARGPIAKVHYVNPTVAASDARAKWDDRVTSKE